MKLVSLLTCFIQSNIPVESSLTTSDPNNPSFESTTLEQFPYSSDDLSTTPVIDELCDDPYTICHNVNIADYQGTTSVPVTNTNFGVDTTFIITFMNQNESNCDNPLLTFIFEQIDYNSDDEYLELFDNNYDKIARCDGQQYGCGTFDKCFQDYEIAEDPIISGQNYTIFITESSEVDALCIGDHPHTTNAELILSCGLNSTGSLDTTLAPINEGCDHRYTFCVDVNIEDYKGTTSVPITNTNVDVNATFIITFMNQGDTGCDNPLLTFIFEQIDYNSDDEYLEIFDDNDNKIETCNGLQFECGNFRTCIQDYKIAEDPILPGQNYTITITESSEVDALCAGNPYSTNAQLILSCGLNATQSFNTTLPATTNIFFTSDMPHLTDDLSTTPSMNIACNDPYTICYHVNIDEYQGTTSIQITNTDFDNVDYYFIITFMNRGGQDCNNPLLTFIFEQIDYNANNEYLELFDTNYDTIARCNGLQYGCGNFETCLQDYEITKDPIISGQNYTITIMESYGVDAICVHPYSTNAELTLSCGLDSTQSSHSTLYPSSEITTNPTVSPTTTPTSSEPTTSTSNIYTTTINQLTEPDCAEGLDIIFIVDSSGSVFDSQYLNWQSELDFVKSMVESSLPKEISRVGLINFSGCGSDLTFEQCKDQGRLKKVFTLNDYGSPNNDLQAVYDRIDLMGPADFNGGFTWTEEALSIALREFHFNSTDSRHKVIVLVTDGEPYPFNAGHEPCKTSTGYISPTLQSLQDLEVEIIAIGVDISQSTIDDFFTCIVEDFNEDFYYANDFSALSADFIRDIGYQICPTTTTTTSTITTAVTATSPTSDACLWGITEFQLRLNGVYEYQGEYNSAPYYQKTLSKQRSFYLWRYSDDLYYITRQPPTSKAPTYFAFCSVTTNNPFECGTNWNRQIDYPDVSVKQGPCPSWKCGTIATTLDNGCDGPFINEVGPNIWSNADHTKYFYFVPEYFSWVCYDEYVPFNMLPSDVIISEPGWKDLEQLGNITIPFKDPNNTVNATVFCKEDICCKCATERLQINPGCPEDLQCETRVCDIDSFCCTTYWDRLCANVADNICQIGNERPRLPRLVTPIR